MKIKLEDADIDAIASAVAAKVGGKPAKPKGKAAEDETEAETETETETAEADFEGETEAETETETATVDRDDVLASLKAVTEKFTQNDAMAILKTVGKVAKLSALDSKKFQAVIDGCKAKLKKK